MKIICLLILSLFFAFQASAQPLFISLIDTALSETGYTLSDLSLPFFGHGNGNFSGNSLLIRQVKESLLNPAGSLEYTEKIRELKDKDFYETLVFLLLTINKGISAKQYQDIYPGNIDSTFGYIRQNRDERKNLLTVLDANELKFLKDNAGGILINPDGLSEHSTDIFLYNELRDSALIKSEAVIKLLSKIDGVKFYSNLLSDAILFKSIHRFIRDNPDFISNLKSEDYNNGRIKGTASLFSLSDIEIVVGGKGNNIYNGHFDIIIDIGGNDVYEIDNPDKSFQNWIIDLKGNDVYSALSDFAAAGAFLTSSFILDEEGNDTYKGFRVSLGSSVAGVSVLADMKGDDTYEGGFFSCGAGMFGAGLLYDKDGNDSYLSDGYSQGFGMTQGMGMILDCTGNDYYSVKPAVKDITRSEDHYKSMSQGFGMGIRPHYAGGIGILTDFAGNDTYISDVYGQGSAYWFSSGYLIDMEGNDNYKSYQYSQGAGIHFASGFLVDDAGDDIFSSYSISQGCGHDYGLGLIINFEGRDIYSASSLSTGTGNANGTGIFADLSGKDIYLSGDSITTKGYGNPRRETISLGVFVDAGPSNYYCVNGETGETFLRTENGLFARLPSEKGNSITKEYKIPFREDHYGTDELFIMAKTIEPRFSEWQKYGYAKLISDSLNTSKEALKYLGSDDAREKLVLYNLAERIWYSLSAEITNYIPVILSSETDEEEKEKIISYACFLLGEYGENNSADLLLSLTGYNSIIIKSAALNALCKLSSMTPELRMSVAGKLEKLKSINTDYMGFYKDLALCLGRYESESAYFVLLELLSAEYNYSVRVPVSEILKKLNRKYSYLLNAKTLNEKIQNEVSAYWFINSLSELDNKEFTRILKILENNSACNNPPVRNKISNVIKARFKF